MRILGIDYGSKLIGVAVSNEERTLARSIGTVPHGRWESELPELVRRYEVNLVVVGIPLSMDNTENPQVRRTLAFMERLKELTGCAVTRWDERLSSQQAERYLLEADLSRAKRRKVIDRLAAQIILQDYLDRQNPNLASPFTAEEC